MMLDDAIAQGGNAYFERLKNYRGGRPIKMGPISASGFTPEECFTQEGYGKAVTTINN
jgi:hypothetical protein